MGKNKGMKTVHTWYGAALLLFGSLVSCMGTVGNSSMRGGEVIGASAVAWNEPAPYGMMLIYAFDSHLFILCRPLPGNGFRPIQIRFDRISFPVFFYLI